MGFRGGTFPPGKIYPPNNAEKAMPSKGGKMTVLGTQIFAFCNQRLSLCFHVSGLKAFHMLPFHFLMKSMQILRMLPPPGAAKADNNTYGHHIN